MLVVRPEHPRRPPGGHSFPEGKTVLTAETADELEQKIVDFRAKNGRPLGNPAREIAQHYQTTAPWLVRHRPDGPTADEREQLAVHIMQIASAAPALWPAHAPEVAARLPVCAGCPFNAPWPEGEATAYVEAADRRCAVLTQDREYTKKGWCSAHQWPIALAQRLRTPAKYAGAPVENCFAHELP